MIPIAICTNRMLARFVGGFRVLDAKGVGTDEILYCETPERRTRAAAIADAVRFLSEQDVAGFHSSSTVPTLTTCQGARL